MTASLFGLARSNRDFSQSDAWGKNQFNSSFPAALCCYMASKGLAARYLGVFEQQYQIDSIEISEMLKEAYNHPRIHFAFESEYTPYRPYVIGSLPRTDLVVHDLQDKSCLRGLEIKLTALPDNTTCDKKEHEFGSEIVVRPDSIVYLACSIIQSGIDIKPLLNKEIISIVDWADIWQVLPFRHLITNVIKNIALSLEWQQEPFLIQPIWKTKGKSPQLAEHCLDVFVWSDAGFCYFMSDISNSENSQTITRAMRSNIWLYKMLLDYVENQQFNHKKIIDTLSYNTKNDKAFAVSGSITNRYMQCSELLKPRITKHEIQNIILGGGQHLLSPERRFDAIIYSTPDLFVNSSQ